MPSHARSLTLTALLAFAAPAAAQIPQPVAAPAPASPEFLSRYDFHMSLYHLYGVDDPEQRYSWDTHFGGSFDLLDFVFGRAMLDIDYEAVMGHEYRPFDPNQANYTLEGSLSARVGKAEVAAYFHHVSRHLSDRPNPLGIAWNVPGGRLLKRIGTNQGTFDVNLELGHVVQHAFVDYTWIGGGDIVFRRPIRPPVGIFAHASSHFFAVDGTIPNRGTQVGVFTEGGVRLTTRGGVLEAFAGFERRVDAFPLQRVPENWALAGFRLLSR